MNSATRPDATNRAQRACRVDDDPPPGAPGWVVTYGDMMSLLLTFFIMLVALSEVNGDARYKETVESIMRYMGFHVAPVSRPGDDPALNEVIEKLRMLATANDGSRGGAGLFAGADLRVLTGREGTSIHAGQALEFAPGSADVSPAARQLLELIGQALAGKPNKVDIRGHVSTEPLPEGCPFPDKLTLSYERARRVMAVLRQSGLERGQMRVSAAGDSEPLPDSPDRQAAREDRVVIYVLDAFARDFVGPRDDE